MSDWEIEKIRIEGKECTIKTRRGMIKVTCQHRYTEVQTPREKIANSESAWKKEMSRLRLEAINKMQSLLQMTTRRRR